MPREVYIWDRELGQNVPKADYYARKHNQTIRSHLATPGIIHDGMSPVQSMTNGRLYDSKAALRQEYRRAGVVEVGNDSSYVDPKPFKKPKPDRKEIKASVERAFSQVNLVS